MSDYIVISHHINDINLFLDEVNAKLDEGFVCQGGIHVTHDDIMYQALVKVTP